MLNVCVIASGYIENIAAARKHIHLSLKYYASHDENTRIKLLYNVKIVSLSFSFLFIVTRLIVVLLLFIDSIYLLIFKHDKSTLYKFIIV